MVLVCLDVFIVYVRMVIECLEIIGCLDVIIECLEVIRVFRGAFRVFDIDFRGILEVIKSVYN